MKGTATVLLEGSGGLSDTYSSSGYVEFGLVVPILYSSKGWGQPNDIFWVKFIVIYLFDVFIGYSLPRNGYGWRQETRTSHLVILH